MMITHDSLPYRAGVGVMLFNRQGLVWIGRRVVKWEGDGSAHRWQCPQGGIDAGESPKAAALRELAEETGITCVEILAETAGWCAYDLPQEALGAALKGKYRGQKQKWFAMRFLGADHDIDLVPPPGSGHHQEFDAWRWVSLDELLELVVPFKRPVYQAVIDEFGPLIQTASPTPSA